MTSFHQRFLGKIYSVTFCLAAEDLSDEKRCVHENASFPILDFLVSSVQFSVNNKSIINYPINRGFPVDAPSKLDNAKLSSDDRPKIVNRWFILILRKEVIQPHLPIRLPCYDFTPVTFPTLDGLAGFGCE